jgi:putative membrane protein
MMEYWSYNYGVLGTIIFVLIWVIIIGIIISVLRALFGSDTTHYTTIHRQTPPPVQPLHPTEKSPLDILNERYARGEIDKIEFDQKRADIAGRHH